MSPPQLSSRAQEMIAAARRKILDRSNPLLEDLPPWFDHFRPHQIDAITQAVEMFESGCKVVVLDAPTGSGKTLIAETVRRLLDTKGLYVCTTKSLQDQFLRDYPYAKLLKGRSNYPTARFADSFHPSEYMGHVSCEDCTWAVLKSCALCPSKAVCPYEVAKAEALSADVAVLNSAYFLTEANRQTREGRGSFSGSPFMIVDEFDSLEQQLMGYVSVDVSERRMEKYGLWPPDKVTVPSSWLEWLDKTIPVLRDAWLSVRVKDTKTWREYSYLASLIKKLRVIQTDLKGGSETWVYTGQGNEGTGRKGTKNLGRAVSFKPSRVDGVGDDKVWSHSPRWLVMSGTVISAQVRMDHLGFVGGRFVAGRDEEVEVRRGGGDDEAVGPVDGRRTWGWGLVRVANTFPKENRRVRFWPAGNMAAKYKEESWPKLADRLVKVMQQHPNDRILVHTVSGEMTNFLVSEVPSPRYITYKNRDSAGKELALQRYKSESGSGKVLLAQSMDRGIDLPGDLCRVQVITKLPFPYLGDRQVSARLHSPGGQMWYTMETIATVIQMCGRGVRSASDWCITYVLDAQFESLVKDNRHLFPKWFIEGVEWRVRFDERGR